MSAKTERAKPMCVEDRRISILDAALPLVLERGTDVTTREIADAAGVAEGTLFRAFDDKQEIIAAAVLRQMDPAATHRRLREIDPGLGVEDTVAAIVEILRDRFTSIAGLMANLRKLGGPRGAHPHPNRHPEALGATVTAEVLARHEAQLRVDPAAASHVIRALVFGTSMPVFGQQAPLTTTEIVDFVLHGIVREEA